MSERFRNVCRGRLIVTTTKEQSQKKVNRIYTDCYLKRRRVDGTYEPEWFDISNLVVRGSLSDIKISLDSKDFDIGVFTTDNVNITFDNRTGRFNCRISI